MNDLWSKKAVAERLKNLRISLQLTQEKMAELLEISVQTYKNMESGNGNISNATLRKMKEKIAFSTDYLLFGERGDLIEVWNRVLALEEREQLVLFGKLFSVFSSVTRTAAKRDDETMFNPLKYLSETDKSIENQKNQDILKSHDK